MKRASVQSYILLTMMALSAVARADDDAFSVELADGVKFSDGGAAFFRYKPGRLEYHLGIWDGDNGNAAIGLGYPLARGKGKLKFRWVPGVAVVQEKTDNLGTNGQFYNRFEFDYENRQRVQMYLALTHYSNGAAVLNRAYEPNRGENFITLGFRFAWGPRPRIREQQPFRRARAQEDSSANSSAQALRRQRHRDGLHLSQALSRRISDRYVEYGLPNQGKPDP